MQTTRETFHNARGRTKRFDVPGKKVAVMKVLYDSANIMGADAKISDTKWKIKSTFTEVMEIYTTAEVKDG